MPQFIWLYGWNVIETKHYEATYSTTNKINIIPLKILLTTPTKAYGIGESNSKYRYGYCSQDRKTYYWYDTTGSGGHLQFNLKGCEYFYVAFA